MLNENICKFIPSVGLQPEFSTLNFVYEKNRTNTQTMLKASFSMNLVCSGKGELVIDNNRYELKKGDVFFTFQAKPYVLLNTEKISFMYINFIGTRAETIFERFNINKKNPVFHGFENMIPLWESSLNKCAKGNEDLTALSVLYGTFAEFKTDTRLNKRAAETEKNVVADVRRYIDVHFQDPRISLRSVAEKFGYNSGYISLRFKNTFSVGVSAYITRLRMDYAAAAISDGYCVVSQIASACGYTDALYFSRVFRRYFGMSPKQMIGSKAKPSAETGISVYSK